MQLNLQVQFQGSLDSIVITAEFPSAASGRCQQEDEYHGTGTAAIAPLGPHADGMVRAN